MANKAKTTNKFFKVQVLNQVASGNVETSRYLLNTLVTQGYLVSKEVKEKTGRGRGKTVWELSGKGRGYLALSKNWKQA